MKRLLLGISFLVFFLFSPTCEAADILFTINANDNANQVLNFGGYEFRFQHMDHRTYLYKEKNVNNGFQWTTPVVTCWLKKATDPETKYELWQQFLFGKAITPVEPGQVYTRFIDKRNVQMLIEKVSYYNGYRANGTEWIEETLPKYITIRIIVHEQ